MAVFAPLIAPYDPRDDDFAPSSRPVGRALARHHHAAARTSSPSSSAAPARRWSSASSAGILATAIALVIGLTAGYLQGMVDEVLSFFINLGLVVPVLPLMIALAAYSPVRGIWLIIIVIAITGWAYGARIKRAQIITLRTRDYITAAMFAGDGTWRIIFREIMPNMISLIVVGFMGAAARRDRRRGRPRLPRSRRPADGQLGHDALLGQHSAARCSPASGPG